MKHGLLLIVMIVAGCAVGVAEWRRYDDEGRLVERLYARQPGSAVESATVSAGAEDGTRGASSGRRQVVDQVGLAQVRHQAWAGYALVLIGLGSLVARAWFPVAPLSVSVIAIGLGAFFIMAPPVTPLMFYGGLGVLGAGAFLAFGDNWVKVKAAVPGVPGDKRKR